ncbi:MAG: GxxExxY protein, partial [Elusimicrobiota bacterium]|nr:GxxExxY protein [Elusimicrobiota bacterium]
MNGLDNSDKDKLTAKIIACCFKVHNELGPGFIERIYANALKLAMSEENIEFEAEKEFEVYFNNENIGKFRVDFVIEDKVILETKSLKGYVPKLFESQVVSYLKASKLNVGLLV